MALAMNRYIGVSILPLLIAHSKFYNEADNYANLLDATLHTVYRLSKNRMLTKGQREAVSDFLVALTRYFKIPTSFDNTGQQHFLFFIKNKLIKLILWC